MRTPNRPQQLLAAFVAASALSTGATACTMDTNHSETVDPRQDWSSGETMSADLAEELFDIHTANGADVSIWNPVCAGESFQYTLYGPISVVIPNAPNCKDGDPFMSDAERALIGDQRLGGQSVGVGDR